jgi:hypothetical protein
MKTHELTQRDLSALPCLHEGRYFTLYLQAKSASGRPVVIKSVRADAGENPAKRLANEFHLTANLRISGVRRPRNQFWSVDTLQFPWIILKVKHCRRPMSGNANP